VILPMLCWILIVGGLLIMMGQHDRSEALFYYFRLEDQVPETHLLRLIEKHISFAFVREKLKASYSDTGRPSIDPELLLRILLIGYLYRHHQRTETDRGTAHAPSFSLPRAQPPLREKAFVIRPNRYKQREHDQGTNETFPQMSPASSLRLSLLYSGVSE
jgi:hypothetical protein